MSVRLSPEITKKLMNEAHRLTHIGADPVTVSEVIRGCIAEKFSRALTNSERENEAVAELREEVFQLKEGHAQLVQEVQNLVHRLSELFPLLASREQVDSLTDGIAAVIRTLKER